MTEPALQFVSQRLTGRSRVYRKLGIVLLALIVTGSSISVIGALCLGALEPLRDVLGNLFSNYCLFLDVSLLAALTK
jgi:hypothetical protein